MEMVNILEEDLTSVLPDILDIDTEDPRSRGLKRALTYIADKGGSGILDLAYLKGNRTIDWDAPYKALPCALNAFYQSSVITATERRGCGKHAVMFFFTRRHQAILAMRTHYSDRDICEMIRQIVNDIYREYD